MNRLDGPQYPAGLLQDVLEAGAYRRLKGMVDAATTKAQVDALPESELVGWVHDIAGELATEGGSDDE